MPGGRRTVLGAVVAAVLLVTAGCSSGPSTGSSSSSVSTTVSEADAADVPGVATVSVSLTQYRADVAPRRVQVKVSQGDGPAVELHGLSVDLPGYAGALGADVDSTTRPGGAVDLPVALGDLSCSGVADGDPVTVRLQVGPDSAPLELEADLSDGFVERFRDRECEQAAFLELAPLAWSDAWVRRDAAEGLVVDGVLEVGPVAAGHTVSVTTLDPTTLFVPRVTETTSSTLPVEVAAGGTAQVPVTMSPARCDAHAVAEDKQGYLFGVRVSLDGAAPVVVSVAPTAEEKTRIEGMLLDHCGLR